MYLSDQEWMQFSILKLKSVIFFMLKYFLLSQSNIQRHYDL